MMTNESNRLYLTLTIHSSLTVMEALTYAAKLRLPQDADLNEIINKTLAQIEMEEQHNVLVKKLSGGQFKRVSIGVKLLVDPKLFFLDELTSGLDPGLDKKMMQLLRKLADQGRTIGQNSTTVPTCPRHNL
ncbi:ATP-binding cassette domain-containing protein [Synechocystis sp. PCC 6714]|uniref:ATP-binding cassette domain-containing protein n=1 Tax=unclassified Synechocystis TaxID=2640012 RepID=UPI0026BDDB71